METQYQKPKKHEAMKCVFSETETKNCILSPKIKTTSAGKHICVNLENKSSTPPAWPASAFQAHWPPVPSLLVPPQNFSRIWYNYQMWEELFFVVDSSYIYETPTLQAFLFQAPPQRDLIKVQWWLLVQFHLFECEVGLLPDFSPRSPGQDKRTPESGSNIYVS